MEGVASTVCVEGFNFERGKMSDGAICGAGIVTAVRSSRNDGDGAPGLREVGTRIRRVIGLTCPPCKVDWGDQIVDQASQTESGLAASFEVSQDGNTEMRYLLGDFG